MRSHAIRRRLARLDARRPQRTLLIVEYERPAGGGAIYIRYGAATITNTIVAKSTSGGNCRGSITDGGHSIDDGTTCGFTGTGCTSTSGSSFCSTSPQLDPAGQVDNGGPTAT